jgi:hypothetical protein
LLQVAEWQGVASHNIFEMRVDFPIVAGDFYFLENFCNRGQFCEEAVQEKMEIFNGVHAKTQRRKGYEGDNWWDIAVAYSTLLDIV